MLWDPQSRRQPARPPALCAGALRGPLLGGSASLRQVMTVRGQGEGRRVRAVEGRKVFSRGCSPPLTCSSFLLLPRLLLLFHPRTPVCITPARRQADRQQKQTMHQSQKRQTPCDSTHTRCTHLPSSWRQRAGWCSPGEGGGREGNRSVGTGVQTCGMKCLKMFHNSVSVLNTTGLDT